MTIVTWEQMQRGTAVLFICLPMLNTRLLMELYRVGKPQTEYTRRSALAWWHRERKLAS